MKKHSLSTKIISIGLIVITVSIYTATASAAFWQTGKFDDGYRAKGYTTVILSDKRKNGNIKAIPHNSGMRIAM